LCSPPPNPLPAMTAVAQAYDDDYEETEEIAEMKKR
jgi:hypothetical protein